MEGKVIVVGTDLADTGDEAIRAGLKQLLAGPAQTLHVVHVVELSAPVLPPEEPERARASPTMSIVLDGVSQRVRALADLERARYGEGQVRIEVRSGDVLTGLLGAIRHHGADLAIVGTHGRQGLDRWLAGSIAERLVRSAPCSVLVARPPPRAGRVSDRVPVERALPAHGLSSVEPAWRPTDPSDTATQR